MRLKMRFMTPCDPLPYDRCQKGGSRCLPAAITGYGNFFAAPHIFRKPAGKSSFIEQCHKNTPQRIRTDALLT